jgi:hypothetical protein
MMYVHSPSLCSPCLCSLSLFSLSVLSLCSLSLFSLSVLSLCSLSLFSLCSLSVLPLFYLSVLSFSVFFFGKFRFIFLPYFSFIFSFLIKSPRLRNQDVSYQTLEKVFDRAGVYFILQINSKHSTTLTRHVRVQANIREIEKQDHFMQERRRSTPSLTRYLLSLKYNLVHFYCLLNFF